MLKELGTTIRKSLAQMFTWPNRYRTQMPSIGGTIAGAVVTPERALNVSSVASAVRLLSETVAALPLHTYRDLSRSKVIELDHANYNLLHSRPNDFQTSFAFFQTAIMHILLHGNFYAVIERNDAGEPVNLWPLRPEGVTVEVADGTVQYRYYFGGKKDIYGYRDVLHFKGPSLDGIIGMSVIGMAREGIGLCMAQDAHAASLFRNGARPGMVLKYAGVFGPDQREQLEGSFLDKFSGAFNAGKTVILEGGLDLSLSASVRKTRSSLSLDSST